MPGGSVTVTVVNNLPGPLTLVPPPNPPTNQGTWSDNNPPPSELTAANSSGSSWTGALDPPEGKGAIGSFKYTYQSMAGQTTFQFNFSCPAGSNNTAAVTATTATVAKAAFLDYSFAMPFLASVDGGADQFCTIATSGSPVTITFYLYSRILSVASAQPASASTPVLNWDAEVVASGNLWTPGTAPAYSDGNGGSTNPLVFPQTIASAAQNYPWLTAEVMSDAATVAQGNQITLHATMTEVVSQQPITFASNQIKANQSLTPNSVNLYVQNPSAFAGVACISTCSPAIVNNPTILNNWVMHTNTNVGYPQLEVYWLYEKPDPMWTSVGGVWVRTLRDIVWSPVPKTYFSDTMTLVQKMAFRIATNCILGSSYNSPQGVGKVYQEGGVQYGGSDYNLWKYYNNAQGASHSPPGYVNCVDQAGFLQVCLGAVGIPSEQYSFNTFGFIETCFLVGNPDLPCNSPDWYLYGRNVSALAAQVPINQTPGQTKAPYSAPYGRIWWQDHLVVQLSAPNSGVLDATLGSQATSGAYFFFNFQAYASAVIDTVTTLYDYWNTVTPKCNKVPDIWQEPAGPLDTGNHCQSGVTFVEPNTGVAVLSAGVTSVVVTGSTAAASAKR